MSHRQLRSPRLLGSLADASCSAPASRAALVALLLGVSAGPSPAAMLLTEVIPNVTTTATRGDVVELYNSGPGAVDLTNWVLTDLDNDPLAGVPQDATFAPASLSLPPLAAGDYAVVDLVDASGTASVRQTNYGLRIVAPLVAGSFLGSERDELMLLDASNTPVDFVAWSDSGTAVGSDSWQDLSAVTGSTFDYGLTPGEAAWAGPENVASDADYYANSVDFTAWSAVSAWGGGAIRRRSTGGVFDVASPDGPAQWEAVPRHRATLGNASDDIPTPDGLRPIRITDDLADWLAQIRVSTFPDRRIAPLADQSPADFVPADLARRSAWEGLLPLAMNGEWDAAFAAADAIGYEVVEFLDTASGRTFHLLRERFVPGEPGFTGMGSFVFYDGAGVRDGFVLEIPHPIHDDLTLAEGALALPQLLPRVTLIAGTHRNNSTSLTGCDGSFENADPYRISDVAHHPDNLFHAAHLWLHSNLPSMLALQLHGFCCPGSGSYASLADDVVVSNGIELAPAAEDFPQLLRGRIDAQGFLADGVDLTTAAVFGDDASVLGATNNLQARISNGVAPGSECNTAASAASGEFVHVEQDPDVRQEPQHMITALGEALDLWFAEPATSCAAMPAAGCRMAGAGKASIRLRDSSDDARDSLQWKWGKGDATLFADFADPVGGSASYHVCIYDGSVSAQPLVDLDVPPGGSCAGKPCWKAQSTKGYAYRNKSSGQVTGLRLGAGAAGKAKLQVRGAGASLGLPPLPLETPVTVQLVIDDGVAAKCWQTSFDGAALQNDAAGFRAKK